MQHSSVCLASRYALPMAVDSWSKLNSFYWHLRGTVLLTIALVSARLPWTLGTTLPQHPGTHYPPSRRFSESHGFQIGTCCVSIASSRIVADINTVDLCSSRMLSYSRGDNDGGEYIPSQVDMLDAASGIGHRAGTRKSGVRAREHLSKYVSLSMYCFVLNPNLYVVSTHLVVRWTRK